MKTITVQFPGGKKVDACFEAFTVHTDQRLEHGGDQTAPSPFDLFFVALATCAGIAALDYCHKHKLTADDLAITLRAHRHPVLPRYDRIVLDVTPPRGLSAKQTEELLAEVDGCAVKRHILTPPSFAIVCQAHANP